MNARTVTFFKTVQRSFFLVLFLILVLSSNSLADTFMFEPATGQTTCYDGSGKEITCPPGSGLRAGAASHPSDLSTYTDNADGTVTHNTTGLMWQKSENPSSYNWYQASGKYDSTYNPSSEDVCGSLDIGSYSDWRLPTKKELMSIIESEAPSPGPTMNLAYFPDAYASLYWSSTTTARKKDNAWAVDFLAGDAVGDSKGNGNDVHVRCVRGNRIHLRAHSDESAKTK